MRKRSVEPSAKLEGKKVEEELDGLNAQTRQRGAGHIRREMEATIEAKARKRRSRETPASAKWQRL